MYFELQIKSADRKFIEMRKKRAGLQLIDTLLIKTGRE